MASFRTCPQGSFDYLGFLQVYGVLKEQACQELVAWCQERRLEHDAHILVAEFLMPAPPLWIPYPDVSISATDPVLPYDAMSFLRDRFARAGFPVDTTPAHHTAARMRAKCRVYSAVADIIQTLVEEGIDQHEKLDGALRRLMPSRLAISSAEYDGQVLLGNAV